MPTTPRVSICIPCFNAQSYVSQTLDCLLAQTWANLEIVVVDDESSDRSFELLKPYRKQGVRVEQQSNSGACAARNRAFSLSSGEYVKFLDADDLLDPCHVESQMHCLRSSGAGVASSEWGRFYDDDLSTFRLNPQSVWRNLSGVDWLVEAFRDAQPMMNPGLWLIPRSLLDRSGGWDENLSLIDDFEFFTRVLCYAEEVRFTPGARLYYRSGITGSLSSRKTRAAAESAFHSILKGTGHLLARRSDPEARLSCANIMQNFIYTFYPQYPDLRASLNTQIVELGGSNLLPAGGPWFHRARRLIGWKAARRLQTLKPQQVLPQ